MSNLFGPLVGNWVIWSPRVRRWAGQGVSTDKEREARPVTTAKGSWIGGNGQATAEFHAAAMLRSLASLQAGKAVGLVAP